jgi:hypothetical protein
MIIGAKNGVAVIDKGVAAAFARQSGHADRGFPAADAGTQGSKGLFYFLGALDAGFARRRL